MKKIIGSIVLAIGLIFFIPYAVNWLFSKSALCDLMVARWTEAEALGYGGDVLSFIGTVVLGAVAVYQTSKAHGQTDRANQLAQDALTQTERANELATQMQKLEQANFVSMVSVSDVQVEKRSVAHPNYLNRDMPNRENIDLTADGFECANCYHIDTMFLNNGDYPIVQIISHAGTRGSTTFLLYGMKDRDSAVYIPPHGKQAIRFIVPSAVFDKNLEYKFSLSVDLINIYDYTTRATIHIKDLEKQNGRLDYSYRLAKFTDVKPQ